MSSIASKLSDLQGLEGAKRAVSRLVESGSETHAVLFYGAPGAGKRSLAEVLAQSWLCLDSENPGCGVCRSCVSFNRGTHPDLLTIRPWGPSSLIKKIALREELHPPKEDEHILPLEIFFRTAPLVGSCKVAIMLDAERMNASAANAFLKTLEEPPPYGRLALTTPAARLLPPTILSRCLGIACELPFSAVEKDELSDLAGGSPGRIAEMAKSREAYRAIDYFAQRLGRRHTGEAPLASDEFRSLVDQFEGVGNARSANTEAVSTLATALRLHYPNRPDWAMAAAEAHRRIVGNGGAAYVFDALFASILTS